MSTHVVALFASLRPARTSHIIEVQLAAHRPVLRIVSYKNQLANVLPINARVGNKRREIGKQNGSRCPLRCDVFDALGRNAIRIVIGRRAIFNHQCKTGIRLVLNHAANAKRNSVISREVFMLPPVRRHPEAEIKRRARVIELQPGHMISTVQNIGYNLDTRAARNNFIIKTLKRIELPTQVVTW